MSSLSLHLSYDLKHEKNQFYRCTILYTIHRPSSLNKMILELLVKLFITTPNI